MSNNLKNRILESIEVALQEPLRAQDIYIHGVEVTQAIQHCHSEEHLTDPASRGPDNSIRLVADKPAVVRVYVRRLGSKVPLDGVFGSITLQRRRSGFWADTDTLVQRPPTSITARPAAPPAPEPRAPKSTTGYVPERGSVDASLNFLIPASAMRGPMRLKVHVEVPGTHYEADTEVEIDASLIQTLRIRGIPVRYQGPDAAGNQAQLTPPTLEDFQYTAADALRMFPVSKTPEISLGGILTWNSPLTGNITTSEGTASCPPNWMGLLLLLRLAKILDGNQADRVYFGLLPNGIPVGNATGCGGVGAVGAAFVDARDTMAHELGHILGLSHAPCGLALGDTGDPAYPAYEPWDTTRNRQATIGEYGFDPTAQTVYSPNFTRDFMSYCTPDWISPYHYRALLQHQLLDPRWVPSAPSLPPYLGERSEAPTPHHGSDPPPWVGRSVHQLSPPDPVPLVAVTGLLRDDRLEIRSVLRIQTRPTTSGRPLPNASVELLDDQDQVVERAPLMRVGLHASGGCGCSEGESELPSGLVQALLPDRDSFDAIRVMRDDEEVWSRRATTDPPTIDDVAAEIDDENLHIRWETPASDDAPIERYVRWSADDGETWQALAVGLDEDEATVPLNVLTSGTALVQVLVSDGFYTVTADPLAVEIPSRPPQVAILWPIRDGTVKTDVRVRLWGMATASDGRVLPEDDLQWELDGEPVGTGTEVWADLPEWDGEHRATLRVSDGDQAGESSVTFFATCSGQRSTRRGQD